LNSIHNILLFRVIKEKLVRNMKNGENYMMKMKKIGLNGQKQMMQNNVLIVEYGLLGQQDVIKCMFISFK